jgi:hypothetical protein
MKLEIKNWKKMC